MMNNKNNMKSDLPPNMTRVFAEWLKELKRLGDANAQLVTGMAKLAKQMADVTQKWVARNKASASWGQKVADAIERVSAVIADMLSASAPSGQKVQAPVFVKRHGPDQNPKPK